MTDDTKDKPKTVAVVGSKVSPAQLVAVAMALCPPELIDALDNADYWETPTIDPTKVKQDETK